MMRFHLLQVIMDYYGKKVVFGEDKRELLVKDVVIGSLMDYKETNSADKIKNYELGVKVASTDGDLDFQNTDGEFILKRIGETQPSLIFGFINSNVERGIGDST